MKARLVSVLVLISTLVVGVLPAGAQPPVFSLAAWWSMDESGQRTDSHGSNHLANYGAGSVAGVQNNATQFNASTEHLYTATDGLEPDPQHTLAFWFRLDSAPGSDQRFITKETSAGDLQFALDYIQSSAVLRFTVVGLAGSVPVTDTVDSAAISTSTWYYVVAWSDSAYDTINIQVNDGSVSSTSHGYGIRASFSPGAFVIGASSLAFTIDEFGYWHDILSSTDKTWLYDSGSGRTYSELNPTVPTATIQPTPTPRDYPNNFISDPAMSVDPGPVGGDGGNSPWRGRDDISWSSCYHATDFASDWATEFWGVTGACSGPGGEEGFWWTVETNQGGSAGLTADDGFYQEFTWPYAGNMYATYFLRTWGGACVNVLVEIRDAGTNALLGYDRVPVCASGWTRITKFWGLGSCPGGIGCPGTYRIYFLTESLPAYDANCGQYWYDWDSILFVDGVTISNENYFGCPGDPQPPEATPTISPTPSNTPTTDPSAPTPTPWPTGTAGPTSSPIPTRTPTYTPPPMATWTAAPTWTAFPSPTELPMTSVYATPPGGWGTPVLPTLVAIPTLEPVAGFTPNATYEYRFEAASTLIAFGSAFATKVYTTTDWATGQDWDPLDFYTTSVGYTGTPTNPLFSLRFITLPIGYLKGLVRYMPNLGPLIMAVMAVMLFAIMTELVVFAYRVVVWVIDKVERFLNLLGEWFPTGG